MLLKTFKFQVTNSINGFDAIEKFKQNYFSSLKVDDMYDLVILDLNMPITNGFEACEKIKKLFTDAFTISYQMSRPDESSELDYVPMNKRMPIFVAISTHIDDDVTQKAKNIGFQKVFKYPLNPESITK